MENAPANKIPDELRGKIGDDLVAGMSRKAAAAKYGIAQATASRIARERGLGSAQPPELSIASKVFMAGVKERRAKLKSDLLDDIDKLRRRAWSEYTKKIAGKDGPYTITEDLPPLSEVRNCYAAIGVALSGYAKLESLDSDTNKDEDAKSLMGDLLEGLTRVNEELESREANGQFGPDVPADEATTVSVIRGEVVRGDDA